MSTNPQQPPRRFKANLVGNEYTIIGNASLGHLRSVTRLVNEQFSQIQLIAPNLSKEDQAMLLVFNAISDQLTKQEELENLKRDLEASNSYNNQLNAASQEQIPDYNQNLMQNQNPMMPYQDQAYPSQPTNNNYGDIQQ